jgi:hypothetical protein
MCGAHVKQPRRRSSSSRESRTITSSDRPRFSSMNTAGRVSPSRWRAPAMVSVLRGPQSGGSTSPAGNTVPVSGVFAGSSAAARRRKRVSSVSDGGRTSTPKWAAATGINLIWRRPQCCRRPASATPPITGLSWSRKCASTDSDGLNGDDKPLASVASVSARKRALANPGRQ